MCAVLPARAREHATPWLAGLSDPRVRTAPVVGCASVAARRSVFVMAGAVIRQRPWLGSQIVNRCLIQSAYNGSTTTTRPAVAAI